MISKNVMDNTLKEVKEMCLDNFDFDIKGCNKCPLRTRNGGCLFNTKPLFWEDESHED